MIFSIRSLNELNLISKSREQMKNRSYQMNSTEYRKDSFHTNKYVNKKDNQLIDLPNIPKLKMRKWVKSKEAVSRFFDELDYNNQIPSSYDLTLLERQKSYDQNNVA